MTPTCDAIEPLIDLYAAGELTPEEHAAARAHLAACPRCRRQLDEARSLQALLDITFQQPAGMARLRQAVRREAGPGRRGHRFPRRLAPLVALLLVAVGLAWLLPSTPRADAGALPAELAFAPPALPDAAPSRDKVAPPSREVALSVGVVKVIQADRRPLAVPLTVTLHNPTDGPLHVALGGPDFALRVLLRGPRVEREPAPPDVPPPVRPRTVILPPRGNYALPLNQLADQRGIVTFTLVPTVPADYRLSVEVRARAWPAGAPGQARVRAWRAGPIALELTRAGPTPP